MFFNEFVGHDDAKLALILNAIDPQCGGVLFFGEKGSGKSTLARLFINILPEGTPFANLPLNVTDDMLLGGIDIEKTIQGGKRVFQEGLLSRADGGTIFVDDINLLSSGILGLLLESLDRGENIVEREGMTLRHFSRFMLIASMNPEEGSLTPHLLDRFGMCVIMESLKNPPDRITIMKKAAPGIFPGALTPGKCADKDLKEKIAFCRSFVKGVSISHDISDYISQTCLESGIAGHRGDIYLQYASRAYAAYNEHKEITKEDVDAVVHLVLTHRRRMLQQIEQEQQDRPADEEEKDQSEQDTVPPEHEPDKNEHEQEERAGRDGMQDLSGQQRESNPKEDIFEAGTPFKTKRLTFRKDRVNRSASGRRTKTRTRHKGGRYVKSVLFAKNDIAIDATIRAAAPFQSLRGRQQMLMIHEEDLRFKQREKKMGHLVIFVVDGSGSMGVQKRMIETKGAIQSLLMDCYQKRDMVSLIVFRKDRAETLLPPTSSVERAAKRLRDIPVGGKTPLAAGLLEAHKLIKKTVLKSPETRFLMVLITDGRANQSITGGTVQDEIGKVSQLLTDVRGADYIVVDTEDKSKFIRTDLAMQIASRLEADYYTIDDLKAEYLYDIVQMKKSELLSP